LTPFFLSGLGNICSDDRGSSLGDEMDVASEHAEADPGAPPALQENVATECPGGRTTHPKGWSATGAKSRPLNSAQWRHVREQRRDLDDELRRLDAGARGAAALSRVTLRWRR